VNVDLALLADYAAVTNEGKLIAAGIFDRLRPPQLPWHHPTMCIALRVHFHPGEEGGHKIGIRLVDPDGTQIVSLDGDATVAAMDPVEGGTAQLVLNLNNVPFKMKGRHSFDVFLDGRYEHSIALVLDERPASPGGPTGG